MRLAVPGAGALYDLSGKFGAFPEEAASLLRAARIHAVRLGVGLTCDSADRMRGPFFLPGDVREGDEFEIGQLGAYGACLRTGFNGFDRARLVEVRDPPLLDTPGLWSGSRSQSRLTEFRP